MHDAGPVGLATPELRQPGELGIAAEQAGDERARAMGGIRMDHDPGRLVDDDHGRVGLDDTVRDLAGGSCLRQGAVDSDEGI